MGDKEWVATPSITIFLFLSWIFQKYVHISKLSYRVWSFVSKEKCLLRFQIYPYNYCYCFLQDRGLYWFYRKDENAGRSWAAGNCAEKKLTKKTVKFTWHCIIKEMLRLGPRILKLASSDLKTYNGKVLEDLSNLFFNPSKALYFKHHWNILSTRTWVVNLLLTSLWTVELILNTFP